MTSIIWEKDSAADILKGLISTTKTASTICCWPRVARSMVFMENFRHNMTEGGNFYNFKITELGDYYDFLAARELLLNDKFQFNAVPFYIGVDKDGNIISYDEVNKYVEE